MNISFWQLSRHRCTWILLICLCAHLTQSISCAEITKKTVYNDHSNENVVMENMLTSLMKRELNAHKETKNKTAITEFSTENCERMMKVSSVLYNVICKNSSSSSQIGERSISSKYLGETTDIQENEGGRTFGKIRRLQMALIPIIFKFGIVTAMIAFLVLLSLKTLFLVKFLVLLNSALVLGKFLALKKDFQPFQYQPVYGYNPGWNQQPTNGWPTTGSLPHQSNKEIHLHIHGAQTSPQLQEYSNTYDAGVQQHHSLRRSGDAYNPIATGEMEKETDMNTSDLHLFRPAGYLRKLKKH